MASKQCIRNLARDVARLTRVLEELVMVDIKNEPDKQQDGQCHPDKKVSWEHLDNNIQLLRTWCGNARTAIMPLITPPRPTASLMTVTDEERETLKALREGTAKLVAAHAVVAPHP